MDTDNKNYFSKYEQSLLEVIDIEDYDSEDKEILIAMLHDRDRLIEKLQRELINTKEMEHLYYEECKKLSETKREQLK